MNRLHPDKLHVTLSPDIDTSGITFPRRYTLTHSDFTGDLFLTIGANFNTRQASGWYTRLMRDEVYAEFQDTDGICEFSVYCHVSGGIIFGTAGMRYQIFKNEMNLVLESFRYGDKKLFEVNPELDDTIVRVYYRSSNRKYHTDEIWGKIGDYR